MADPEFAANGLTHVATVNAWASHWDGLAQPVEITAAAGIDFVGVGIPGIACLPLTADEAVELADALAEAAATARNLERERNAEAPMVAHARSVVESCLGIRWPG